MTAHAERSAGVYEPWVPEIGQRIRIRISTECRVVPSDDSPQADASSVGHELWEDGLIGAVVGIVNTQGDEGLVRQGHRFDVIWDRPRLYHGEWVDGAAYAAAELVPLTAARVPDEREVGQDG